MIQGLPSFGTVAKMLGLPTGEVITQVPKTTMMCNIALKNRCFLNPLLTNKLEEN